MDRFDPLVPAVCSSLMDSSMAFGAQCDQVLFGVISRLAAKLFVVNLKIGQRSAQLATPAVASQHLLS